ncbi:MAG: metal-dependent hydrolase, partial [Planctomycetaceae bacterium]|nr:metal-dependent hydrolase [Planctomycetaceae bacterium]
MHIQILGSGGYYPNDRRHTACLYLPEIDLVLDAGSGFYRIPPRLHSNSLQICLTHAHLDHVIGLTYLLVPLAIGQLHDVTVRGTRETLAAVREHLFAERLFPVEPRLRYEELSRREVISSPEWTLTHQRLQSHPSGSVAYRLDLSPAAGRPARSMAYVTDTMVDGTYTEFIRGVDLLLHECNFNDDMADWCERTGHSHTSKVAQLAEEAQVGRLVLLHLDPLLTGDDPVGLPTARRIFPNT